MPEVPEDHEVLGAGDIYEINIQKTSDYDTTIDLYVTNIEKYINNTWKIIYKATYERYFVEVRLFPIKFINLEKIIQMSQKSFELIPRKFKKNRTGKMLYAQVAKIYYKSRGQKKDTVENKKGNT